MVKPACVSCGHELQVATVGVLAIELYQHNSKPYKAWNADLLECPTCGLQIVSNFGNEPIAMHEACLPEIEFAQEHKRKIVYIREP